MPAFCRELLVVMVVVSHVAFGILRGAMCANLSQVGYDKGWIPGHATWYGDPHGEGSSGGACGFTKLTGSPYGSAIAAGSSPIFAKGKGCGQCYHMMCTYSCCRANPIRIVITDECPGGTYCSTGEPAFDLSGHAISSMALPGKDAELRNIGLYNIKYKRVPCDYANETIAFRVDAGSNPFHLALSVRYTAGSGDIESVAIREKGSSGFITMRHDWGCNYVATPPNGRPLKGPFDIMVTARLHKHAVVATETILDSFTPGKEYVSKVQFEY